MVQQIRRISIVVDCALITIILLTVFCQTTLAEKMVIKEVCLTPFGMQWKTSEDAKNYLITLAKQEASNELCGELIQSITRVENFVLTKHDIQAVSLGFIRVKGVPQFYNGQGFGEMCVRLESYISDEDQVRFQPRSVQKKACIAEPHLPLGDVKQTAERQARIESVREFEPKLDKVRDDILLTLIHETKIEESGFIPETTTYCVKVQGIIYPIELLAAIEQSVNLESPPVISDIILSPTSPGKLKFNQQVNISFNYTINEQGMFHILAIPSVNSKCGHYAGSPEPGYPSGKGKIDRYFEFKDCRDDVKVNQIKIIIYSITKDKDIFETFIPVDYYFTK